MAMLAEVPVIARETVVLNERHRVGGESPTRWLR